MKRRLAIALALAASALVAGEPAGRLTALRQLAAVRTEAGAEHRRQLAEVRAEAGVLAAPSLTGEDPLCAPLAIVNQRIAADGLTPENRAALLEILTAIKAFQQ